MCPLSEPSSRSGARSKIQHLLAMTPLLLEYATTAEEEDDEDDYQLRKCRDFKRMLVEAVSPGENLGVPVPLGYSDAYVSARSTHPVDLLGALGGDTHSLLSH